MVGIFNSLLLGLAYRFRGGAFYQTRSDTLIRTIWATAFGLAYLLYGGEWHIALLLSVLSFIAVAAVPHGFCMGMGTEANQPTRLRDRWPAFFMPVVEWSGLDMFSRVVYDYCQMTGVAFVRAVIVYVPVGFITHDLRAVYACAILMILQPFGYWLGFRIPVTLQWPWLQNSLGARYASILQAKSTEWGELFNGAAWAISLSAFS